MYVDHHVHLGLVDWSLLPDGELGGVVDLGWSPAIGDIARDLRAAGLRVDVAGGFLTAPGGYPSDRPWAPRGSTAFVAEPDDADAAVAAQRELGATVVKVTLNRDAGPVPDLATLEAVVRAADGLPVVAHVQGAGMLELALAAGVATIAHAPWTHHLDDAVIAECVEAGQGWISTLDIHGFGSTSPDQERALDNLGRFHQAGGRVLYGTDLGNGPLPAGLNHRELDLLGRAGLDDVAVQRALTDPWPRGER